MFHIASSKGPPEIPQHLSPECKDFLYLCFNRDWKARPAASTLLRHPFLADVAVRSQSGPSPNAAALAHALRAQQPAERRASGSMAGLEGSAVQSGTPASLPPKMAAAPAELAGAARVSLQVDASEVDSTVVLSPLGTHAARRQRWESAAATQRCQQGAAPAAPQPGGRTGAGSPIKRPVMLLRASAPAFSGYASLALSEQQSGQLSQPLGRPGAPAQQQPTSTSHPRSSRDSGTAATCNATADTSIQQLPRSATADTSVRQQLAKEASATRLHLMDDEPAVQSQATAAAVQAAPPVSETPAAQRQRPGVQDLMAAEPADTAAASPAAADSVGDSSGTNKVQE